MTKPKFGGYVHRRMIQDSHQAAVKARNQLQRALGAQSPQAQATLLCACALALGDVIAKLTEMQLLLAADDWGRGEAEPPAPPARGQGLTKNEARSCRFTLSAGPLGGGL
jgi:hypothetical protein